MATKTVKISDLLYQSMQVDDTCGFNDVEFWFMDVNLGVHTQNHPKMQVELGWFSGMGLIRLIS